MSIRVIDNRSGKPAKAPEGKQQPTQGFKDVDKALEWFAEANIHQAGDGITAVDDEQGTYTVKTDA